MSRKRVDMARRIWAARLMGKLDQQCAEHGIYLATELAATINALIAQRVDVEHIGRYFAAIREGAKQHGISPASLELMNHTIGMIEERLGIPLSPDSAAAHAAIDAWRRARWPTECQS